MAETMAQKNAREKREAELTAKIEAELRVKLEKEYEDKLAEQKLEMSATATTAAAQAKVEPAVSDEPSPDSVTVHFVLDGCTLLGDVWYADQVLTVTPGSRNWEALMIADGPFKGLMVLNLTRSQQIKRWGKVHFMPGPLSKDEEELAS